MNKAELAARRDEMADKCLEAYFGGEKYLGRYVQGPNDSFKSGFDAALSVIAEMEVDELAAAVYAKLESDDIFVHDFIDGARWYHEKIRESVK